MTHVPQIEDPAKPTVRIKLRCDNLPVKDQYYYVNILMPCMCGQHVTKVGVKRGWCKSIFTWDENKCRLDLDKLAALAAKEAAERAVAAEMEAAVRAAAAAEPPVAVVASAPAAPAPAAPAALLALDDEAAPPQTAPDDPDAPDAPALVDEPAQPPTQTAPLAVAAGELRLGSLPPEVLLATQPPVADAAARDIVNLVSDSEDYAGGDVGGGVLAARAATTVRRAAPLSAVGLSFREQKVVRARTERLEDLIGHVVVGNFDEKCAEIEPLLTGVDDDVAEGVDGLSQRARVWGYTPGDETAMHRAVRRGLPKLVELLLDKGVDCHPPPAAGTDHNRDRSANVSAMLLVTLLMGEQKLATGGHLDIDDVSRPPRGTAPRPCLRAPIAQPSPVAYPRRGSP